MAISPASLLLIAEAIVETSNDPRSAEELRNLHQNPDGAELLRLIVRDDLAGAGSVIADALWSGL